MEANEKLLRDALDLALADEDFMGNNKKVSKAVDALTPKTSVTAVFKRLQRNALGDYAVNKENGTAGYTDETKVGKIKMYVYDRFKSYMDAPKTFKEATNLFNTTFPPETEGEPEGNKALD